MARKLRIAASVFFAVVAVALCVLWVRSYRTAYDGELRMKSNAIRFATALGLMGAGFQQSEYQRWKLDFGERPIEDGVRKETARLTTYGFGYVLDLNRQFIIVPLWLPIAFATAMAWWSTGCAFRDLRRFSLRALLIATTLVAVVLGLGVWLAS